MTQRHDEADDDEEIPVGELTVDLRTFSVRLPGGGHWAFESNVDHGLIDEDTVTGLALATVAEALSLLSDRAPDGAPASWLLEIDPPARSYEYELHEGLALESHGADRLYVVVSIRLPAYFDEPFERGMEQLVAPMLGQVGAVGRLSHVSEAFGSEITLMVRYESMTGRAVGDLIRLGDDVRALLIAARIGRPDVDTALGLALGGHAAALVGQPESAWLDAKKQLWALGTPAGNAEAAKDLSALANARGGMIIIPARTTVVSGREVISHVGDMPSERIDVTQIRDVLNRWVFPPLPGLITEVVPTTEGRALLVVAVAQHEPELWPHLVVGDPGNEFPRQAFSAWERDEDRNRALTAPAIHALIRAGRHSGPVAPPGR